MVEILGQIDNAFENAEYLMEYGPNVITGELEMQQILNKYFTKWRNKLLIMESKGNWFKKIKEFSDTFESPILKGDKAITKSDSHIQDNGCHTVVISKEYFPPLTGDALEIQEFTKDIMGEWNEYIREDLKGLSKQVDGTMIANFNVSGQAFVNQFYQNLEDKKFILKDKMIKKAITERTEWLTDRIGGMEWERITRKTADWFYNKGLTPAEMRKWISTTEGYERTYKGRSLSIARTEVAWAQNNATRIQMYKSGVPFKKFVTEPRDIWPCDLCTENEDAGVIKVEDEFPNGPVPTHVRCRCSEVPVVPDDWSPVQEWFGEGGTKPDVVLMNPDGSFGLE